MAEPKKKPEEKVSRRKNQRTKAEADGIVLKIVEGLLAYKKPRDLMKELDIPKSTFYYYYPRALELAKEETIGRVNELLVDFALQTNRDLERLEQHYKDSRSRSILVDKAHVRNQAFDRLQSAGFLPKASDKLEVEGKVELKDWLSGMVGKKKNAHR